MKYILRANTTSIAIANDTTSYIYFLQKKHPETIAYQNSWFFIPLENEKRTRFEAFANTFYNTSITNVNTQSPSVTANEINQVVFNATMGKILNSVNQGELT